LVDGLWDDDPPETAVATLQVLVHRLRKLLPDGTLLTRGTGYELAVEPRAVDLFRAEQLLAEARKSEPEASARLLREALALWRGPALADLDEPATRLERGRLEDLRLIALEERIAADLALGRHADLIGELEILVSDFPHRERFHEQLMLALYRSGRQTEALAAYRRARAALDEVGIEPGERLRQLELRILAHDPDLLLLPPLVVNEIVLPAPLRVASPFPFVGRSDALATLRSLLGLAHDRGGGQVAVVGGEAGSGKTRLLRELASEAAGDGMLVLYGSSQPVGGPPYEPIVEALEFLIRETDADALDACLAGGRGEIARLVPELGPPAPAADDPDTARHRLERAVVDLLTRASRQHPLVVVLDDIHWADPASLHVLRRLARAAPEGRLLLLAAYRDRSEDMRPEFFDARADLARNDGVTHLTVAGLSGEAVAELICRLTDARDADAVHELATAVRSFTDGLPFLLCELWRLLVDSGALETSDGAPRLIRPLAELDAPEGVREVVQYRLSRLTPSTTALLDVAAVAGRQFDLSLLNEASGAEQNEVAASLEEALSSGAIEELPGPRLTHRFSHELVRRAVYDRLSTIRGATLHAQVGEALERLHAADTNQVVSELAHHFTIAAPLGDGARAVRYNLQAARAAMDAFALEEAATRFSTALELGIPDASTRGRIQFELARALWVTGKQQRAAEVLDEALATASAAGDEQLEWYVRLELAGIRPNRDPVQLESVARRAVEVFGRLADDLGLARAHRRLALAASHRCAFGDAARESEEALPRAIAAGDRQEETRIVDALCTSLLYGPTPAAVAVERCGELMEGARGSPLREAVVLSSLAGLQAMRGKVDDAREEYRRAREILAELELPFFIAGLSVISGPIELAAGNAEEAERLLRTGLDLVADRGAADAIAYRSALLALALLAQDKRDEAASVLADVEPTRPMTQIAYAVAAARVHDDLAAARDAVALASKTQAPSLTADSHACLAELLESRREGAAGTHRRRAIELYALKGNELAIRALPPAAARA
jgi:tetratricopeptide (TPR) repeat protein